MSVVDLVERIGRDDALHADEMAASPAAAQAARPFWAAYEEHFRRFCGARLDPQFWRLDHPARWTGSVQASGDAPIVVVGTGPSLTSQLPELKRLRGGVHLFTSPRGAEALAEAGLVPDLVLVEHQTALDAMFSVTELAHRRMTATAGATYVAASPNTPAALLAGVAPDRVFIPDPLPTWGMWPATAVAMALHAKARTVALVGVDLGHLERPDPRHAPLVALLGLLAEHAEADCVDAGPGGAVKRGWHARRLHQVAGDAGTLPLTLAARPWTEPEARHDAAAMGCDRLTPLCADASLVLAAAIRVRQGDRSPASRSDLACGFERLLAAGGAADTRRDVQDGLGVSFLPRYWRHPPDPTLGDQLWRPAALAAHELVRQHASLSRRLTGTGGAR